MKPTRCVYMCFGYDITNGKHVLTVGKTNNYDLHAEFRKHYYFYHYAEISFKRRTQNLAIRLGAYKLMCTNAGLHAYDIDHKGIPLNNWFYSINDDSFQFITAIHNITGYSKRNVEERINKVMTERLNKITKELSLPPFSLHLQIPATHPTLHQLYLLSQEQIKSYPMIPRIRQPIIQNE